MSRVTLILVTLLIVASAGTAMAQCTPSPATSTFPVCITTCPRGDIPITVVLNDAAGNPCANSFVFMVFSGGCAPGAICVQPGQPYPVYTAVSNAAGVATFTNVAIGGCCGGAGIQFLDAAGNLLYTVPTGLNSPDIDANCTVNLNDLGQFAAALNGVYNRCADYDWNGVISLADLGLFAAHFGH